MTDDDKCAAALAAIDEVSAGMLVGLGTGTTAAFAIRALGGRVAEGLAIRAVATSTASERLARALGIEVIDFADVASVDLTIDGADEIAADCTAIKGAGGAMLREKVVAAASRRMVVIADGSKRVDRLGAAKLPVEILPFARAAVLATLGESAALRMAGGEPYRTDSGNLIADCRFDLGAPGKLAVWLDSIPGVLGHGLFLNEVDAAYIATGASLRDWNGSARRVRGGIFWQPDRMRRVRLVKERGPYMSDTQTAEQSADTKLHEDGSLSRLTIDTIRTLSMDAVQKASSGHPGTPMALAPVGYELWSKFLRYDPSTPDWPNRDRFVLSVGHASMLLYSLIHLAGIEEIDADGKKTGKEAVSLADIEQFRQLSSKTPGHPEYRHTTGVETTTGPLGQGCGNSVGMAIAERWLAARYNKDGFTLFDHDVYALCGDGDMMEGVASEAASLAGHLKLSNLCWIYDSNHISIEGDTDLAFDEDTGKRFEGYGWNVIHVDDANDTDRFAEAIETFKATDDKPTFIVVHSVIGYGSSIAGTSKAHSDPMGEDVIRATKKAYGWPEDKSFYVPDGVAEHFHDAVADRGGKLREQWDASLARYKESHPTLGRELELMLADKLPDDWDADIPVFPADEKGLASRDAGGKVLNAIVGKAPWLIGGSADLAPSTKTDIKGADSFEAGNYAGRNFHFGVREHGMGAVVNGMTLSHLKGYGSTFFVFLDYMRPPVRLSSIMELGAVWIFTHDSIGVGEDGPTHQPIEQLAMMRATPGIDTFRPGDANEVACAWRAAMENSGMPTALVLSRQPLPTLDRERYASAEGVMKGGYVLADCDGTPDVILIATGSEVSLVVKAHEKLKSEGVKSRVVSMPSWYRYELQSNEYKESVLPKGVKARLAVEMAGELGWDRYVGHEGRTITMSTFGASAPLAKLTDKFGFTVENVVSTAKSMLENK